MSTVWKVLMLGRYQHILGHYLLHISFSSGTFSKVRAGGRPLPLCHYSPTAKKFSSWTREDTLPVKEVKSGGKRSRILGSETSFSCFAVH